MLEAALNRLMLKVERSAEAALALTATAQQRPVL
jgi:hypothetical protein